MEISFKQGDANWITELPREDFPLLPELEELKTVIANISKADQKVKKGVTRHLRGQNGTDRTKSIR